VNFYVIREVNQLVAATVDSYWQVVS